MIALLLVGGAITAIVFAAGGGDSHPALAGSPSSTAAATTAESTPQNSSGGGPKAGNARPLPPPTPTGTAYDDEPPAGVCIDVARGAAGTVLYKAECTDPSASLFLEKKQPQKCDKGYFGLRGFSGQILCFTYTVAAGDCVDLDLPRRAACTPTPATGPKGKITITDIHPGEQDGTQCPDPTHFLAVGKGAERGIACYTPLTASGDRPGSAPPIPSR